MQEIFYSRKNFQRPELQKPPHKNFSEEVKILEKYFGAGAGLNSHLTESMSVTLACDPTFTN